MECIAEGRQPPFHFTYIALSSGTGNGGKESGRLVSGLIISYIPRGVEKIFDPKRMWTIRQLPFK
jgi:hypothetical protein